MQAAEMLPYFVTVVVAAQCQVVVVYMCSSLQYCKLTFWQNRLVKLELRFSSLKIVLYTFVLSSFVRAAQFMCNLLVYFTWYWKKYVYSQTDKAKHACMESFVLVSVLSFSQAMLKSYANI